MPETNGVHTRRHVAVLMGGLSSERTVSLSSGEAVAEALESEGYRVTTIDVDWDISARLAKLRPDVTFNALHGPLGEDGSLQGILEYLQIPYTHSGVLASALGMDKARAKAVVSEAGVPVAQSLVLRRSSLGDQHPMKPPYVIKPLCEGSSLGVMVVREGQAKPPAIDTASENENEYGAEVLVERYIHGRELTCGVMGDKALAVAEVVLQQGGGHDFFFDHEAKYASGGAAEHVIPARIPEKVYARVQELALAAHRALGCRGVSRSDFRYDDRVSEDGEVIWLEVNTQPGMTATSLLPDMARHAGYSLGGLVRWMVEDASCRR